MYRLSFYVPGDWAERVRGAIFAAGAGRMGNYECCCWETRGRGRFRPLPGSRPAVGRAGETAEVDELKIETVCDERVMADVIEALIAAHPYEEPAYGFWRVGRLEDLREGGWTLNGTWMESE